MMQIAIASPDLEAFVRQSVTSGSYGTPEDVIAAGLAMLQHAGTADMSPGELAELRAAIAVGTEQLDCGQTSDWNAQSMKDRISKAFGSGKAG